MSGNILPFRGGILTPELRAAADAAALALRTFKVSPELDRAIAQMRVSTNMAARTAFKWGLWGLPTVTFADEGNREALLRGRALRARLHGQRVVTLMPRRWPWTTR